MNFTAWLPLAGVCLLGAMSPGPSLAMIIRQTLGGSRQQGVCAAAAHGVGVGLFALAAVQGLALVLTAEPWLFRAITWAGAAFLCWLGWQSLRAGGDGPALADPAQARSSLWRSTREGLVVALSNPHLAVFFLALFSQFVVPGMSWAHKAGMVLLAGVLDMAWYSLVALLLSHPRVLTLLRCRMGWVNRATGVVLLLMSVRVLTL
ncbi:MAG: LysE family translocator [Paludibacterium sp.]|uniref:LysE family translocator n=1 Tax=Paludibacterium sp. TaxID=1917523 RepID=UPI0025EAAD75|nr:LysE family translocator [Paludibacterium sp.]MBV8047183.1 LysE family translocator [Paludibacterium sp.]MBV8647724.1 LysE family translocator [Paludibacterium sp.]